MNKWLALTAVATTALLAWGSAARAQPVEMEGQKFEPTVQVGGQTLTLNGVGLRKRAIFKVYVNGLYVPQKSTDAATLINEKGARRASLRMLRDVDADSFVGAFTDGLKANLSEAQLAALWPCSGTAPQASTPVASLKPRETRCAQRSGGRSHPL